MSTQAQLKNEVQTAARVVWHAPEALNVAQHFVPLRITHPEMTNLALLEKAQLCLPVERRRVFAGKASSIDQAVSRLNECWNTFAANSPHRARALIEAAERSSSEPTEKQTLIEEVEQTPVPPATPALGPMELALQTLVQRAVEGSLGTVIAELREQIAQQNEVIHQLMTAQHDSLMCYWDEDFKRTRLIAGEYLGDISGITPAKQLEQVRVQRKRVLVVSTGARGLRNTIESRFSGVDFTFEEGDSQKPFKAGDFYHLVLCNGTNKPAVRQKLVDMHGKHKVNFISGGSSMMIDTIRSKLGI